MSPAHGVTASASLAQQRRLKFLSGHGQSRL